MKKVFVCDFISFASSVPKILEKAGLGPLLKNKKKIILKPNLTLSLPPPCTTPGELTEEVVKFCRQFSKAEIIITEGSGGCDTEKSFTELGYRTLAEKCHVGLVDLNREERILLENPKAKVLKRVRLPKIVFEGFFINLPVLKQHAWAILTCATKNLFGIYLNQGSLNNLGRLLPKWWNKSELHYRYGVQPSVFDLNLYRPADFVLVDASIGQLGNEIHGTPCNPPIKKLFCGFDNLEVDRFCAPYLGLNPESIPYLNP